MKRAFLILCLAALGLSAADLSGKWLGTLETSRGVEPHFLTLQQKGTAITGTVAFGQGRWEIRDAKFDGRRLTFQVMLGGQSNWVLAYDLSLVDGELAGRVKAKQGDFPGGRLNFTRER